VVFKFSHTLQNVSFLSLLSCFDTLTEIEETITISKQRSFKKARTNSYRPADQVVSHASAIAIFLIDLNG
jgi:hypothetical protein